MTNIKQMYLESSKRWQESAAHWRKVAAAELKRNDIRLSAFALELSQQSDRWAEQDLNFALKIKATL